MNATLFKAVTAYVELMDTGLSNEEMHDAVDWATNHKDDALTIEDYITPADNGTN